MSDPQKGEEDSKASGSSNPGKIGWSAIEAHLQKYDENAMKVFSDDIDTLLVFAGLFSAVLTAFVVPAYQTLLEQDSGQLSTQILSNISSQLESFKVALPFLNSTVLPERPASGGLSFRPSAVARLINVLWFLSLLFSLSSALFGIFAKQWIREYLQWNQTTASPRQNVLVRQLRFEAWEDWKVPAGISAIPALLETAVVLFLIGLVVLLWTLDFVVASIITIATSIILLIASTVTVLPAFYHRCPYKSPTGWACVLIWDAIVRSYRLARRFSARHILQITTQYRRVRGLAAGVQFPNFDRSVKRLPQFQSWRQRDTYIDWLISREVSDAADVVPSDIIQPIPAIKERIMQNVGEILPLSRALVWVCQASEDVKLWANAARCAETLHTHGLVKQNEAWEAGLFGSLYAVRRFLSKDRKTNQYNSSPNLSFREEDRYTLTEGRISSWKSFDYTTYLRRKGVSYRSNAPDIHDVFRVLDEAERWVFSHVFLYDIEACFTHVHWKDNRMEDWVSDHGSWARIAHYVVLMEDLITSAWQPDGPNSWREGCGRLIQTYNSVVESRNLFYTNGMHSMLLEIACMFGEVSVVDGKIGSSATHVMKLNTMEDSINLAIQIFDQNPNYSEVEGRHRFVMMADALLRTFSKVYIKGRNEYKAMESLLQRMTTAVTISLDQGYPDCGCRHSLPWVHTLLSYKELPPLLEGIDRLPHRALNSLVDALDKCMGESVVVSPYEHQLPNDSGTSFDLGSDEQDGADEVIIRTETTSPLLTGTEIRKEFPLLRVKVHQLQNRRRGPVAEVRSLGEHSMIHENDLSDQRDQVEEDHTDQWDQIVDEMNLSEVLSDRSSESPQSSYESDTGEVIIEQDDALSRRETTESLVESHGQYGMPSDGAFQSSRDSLMEIVVMHPDEVFPLVEESPVLARERRSNNWDRMTAEPVSLFNFPTDTSQWPPAPSPFNLRSDTNPEYTQTSHADDSDPVVALRRRSLNRDQGTTERSTLEILLGSTGQSEQVAAGGFDTHGEGLVQSPQNTSLPESAVTNADERVFLAEDLLLWAEGSGDTIQLHQATVESMSPLDFPSDLELWDQIIDEEILPFYPHTYLDTSSQSTASYESDIDQVVLYRRSGIRNYEVLRREAPDDLLTPHGQFVLWEFAVDDVDVPSMEGAVQPLVGVATRADGTPMMAMSPIYESSSGVKSESDLNGRRTWTRTGESTMNQWDQLFDESMSFHSETSSAQISYDSDADEVVLPRQSSPGVSTIPPPSSSLIHAAFTRASTDADIWNLWISDVLSGEPETIPVDGSYDGAIHDLDADARPTGAVFSVRDSLQPESPIPSSITEHNSHRSSQSSRRTPIEAL